MQDIKLLIYQVFDILKYEIGIDEKHYYHLENNVKNARIYIITEREKTIRICVEDKLRNIDYRLELILSSQVIAPLPCLKNFILHFFSPILVIYAPDDCYSTLSVMHEIVHLLSIGEYRVHHNSLIHTWGLNYYFTNKKRRNILFLRRGEMM